MRKNNVKNQAGGIDGKQLAIIAGITLVCALMIVVIFLLLKNRQAADTGTDDFLKSIEAQRQGQQPNDNSTPNSQENFAAYEGVLMAINSDSIVITEKTSQIQMTIGLANNPTITYNGQAFSRDRFFIGDQLKIQVKQENNNWQAASIMVLVSASPATSKPVPPAVNVRPDGAIKPL